MRSDPRLRLRLIASRLVTWALLHRFFVVSRGEAPRSFDAGRQPLMADARDTASAMLTMPAMTNDPPSTGDITSGAS